MSFQRSTLSILSWFATQAIAFMSWFVKIGGGLIVFLISLLTMFFWSLKTVLYKTIDLFVFLITNLQKIILNNDFSSQTGPAFEYLKFINYLVPLEELFAYIVVYSYLLIYILVFRGVRAVYKIIPLKAT